MFGLDWCLACESKSLVRCERGELSYLLGALAIYLALDLLAKVLGCSVCILIHSVGVHVRMGGRGTLTFYSCAHLLETRGIHRGLVSGW